MLTEYVINIALHYMSYLSVLDFTCTMFSFRSLVSTKHVKKIRTVCVTDIYVSKHLKLVI